MKYVPVSTPSIIQSDTKIIFPFFFVPQIGNSTKKTKGREMDVERALKTVEGSLSTDKEIHRILNSFRLDSYSLLELQPGCSEDDIKKLYRKKSLLIHPDKTDNKRAPDAFDLLKKAHNDLLNEESRIRLDNKFTDSRRMLILQKKWTVDDDRLKGEGFLAEWREKVKELLIEEELMKKIELKKQMEEEGEEQRRNEEAQERRKLQQELKTQWENERDHRVGNWRNYAKKIEKKKIKLRNKKPKVLI